MGKLILILGAARSGKSTYAVELAKKFSAKGSLPAGRQGPASGGSESVTFIATAAAGVGEMEKRIAVH